MERRESVCVCLCVCVCMHACVLWFESLIIIVIVISPLVLSQHGCLNLVSVKHTRLVCAYRFVLSKRFIIVMTSESIKWPNSIQPFQVLGSRVSLVQVQFHLRLATVREREWMLSGITAVSSLHSE